MPSRFPVATNEQRTPCATGCPAWLDLFLRASRSLAFEGWHYQEGRCWYCLRLGLTAAIDLHPLGRAYGAEICLGCHSLRVTFCDEDLSDLDWEWLVENPPPGLYTIDCCGSGWPPSNNAVAALRRAIEAGERAEEADWYKQPTLTLVGSDSTDPQRSRSRRAGRGSPAGPCAGTRGG
jgi:hypothetical protein